MVELRWLVRNEERVLQMRQQYDPNVYAGWPTVGGPTPQRVWSDWSDIREVLADDTK